MPWIEFALYVGCAMAYGMFIGIERQVTGHNAGIRISMLVCTGSCMFALYPQVMGTSDHTRMAAQIVTGVGFLCSGIIFKDGMTVKGLNTAATIWCTAAVGVLTSTGDLVISTIAAALLLVSNVVFRGLSRLVQPIDRLTDNEYEYHVKIICRERQEFETRSFILNYLKSEDMTITNLESKDIPEDRVQIEATLFSKRRQGDKLEALVAKIGAEPGISSAGWKHIE